MLKIRGGGKDRKLREKEKEVNQRRAEWRLGWNRYAWPITGFFLTAVSAIFLLLYLLIRFSRADDIFERSGSTEALAAFGDYFGGVGGTIFGFFGFMALLFTIFFQFRELRISNQTLTATRDELAQTRAAYEQQLDQNKKDSRQRTFLLALERHERELDSLLDRSTDLTHPDLAGPLKMSDFLSSQSPGDAGDFVPRNEKGMTVSRKDRITLAELCGSYMTFIIVLGEYEVEFNHGHISRSFRHKYMDLESKLKKRGYLHPEMWQQPLEIYRENFERLQAHLHRTKGDT